MLGTDLNRETFLPSRGITSNKGTQTALGKKQLDPHSLLWKACRFMTYSELRLLEHEAGCEVALLLVAQSCLALCNSMDLQIIPGILPLVTTVAAMTCTGPHHVLPG